MQPSQAWRSDHALATSTSFNTVSIRQSLPISCLFFPLTPPPPRSTLFPYTTLFRSAVPFQFEVGIDGERRRCPERVHLNGMVDDQIDLLKRIDPLRIAAPLLDHITHRRQINDRGNKIGRAHV